ncbi:MAG: cation:proton antiporter [Gallionella sp.]|nr:cation:proton antiporter [Gallionella sp.]MDD4947850.1 cation:proton antiporter [Gallionella sp.]
MNYLPDWPITITPFMAFGLMLLMGAMGGYVAHRVSWIPSITGFMAVGVLFGPSGIGLLSPETMANSRIIIDIALALILYRLGLSLDIKQVWRSHDLLMISALESLVTFCAVFLALDLFHIEPVIAALVAAISISSSPAVLLHVAHEVKAKGEVTETTKTLVALNNLLSFLAFSAVLPAMHLAAGARLRTVIIQPLYQLLGSLLLGAALAYGLHILSLKTHRAPQYKLALVIGTLMFATGLAHELKLSLLLVPLVIGVVVMSLEREKIVSDLEFGSAFELFFVVLFVFAGAGLHLDELVQYAPVVLMLVVARSLAKVAGVAGTSEYLGRPRRGGFSSGLLLIPMAGLAIGLAQTSSTLFPAHSSVVTAIVLGAVTVFETMGPPIAAFAFKFAGEAAIKQDDGEQTAPHPKIDAQPGEESI